MTQQETELNTIPLSIIISNEDNNNADQLLEDLQIINLEEPIASLKKQDGANKKVPVLAYIILALALLAMSSSGVALKSINAPPLLKAGWRLQSTSILLFFGFIYEIITIYNYHLIIIKSLPEPIIKLILKFNKNLNINSNNNNNNNNNNSNNKFQKLNEENKDEEEEEEDDIIILNEENQDNIENSNNNEKEKEKENIKIKLFEKKTLLILLATGIMLGFHFSFWVVSLDKTTLAHSLLFVTSSPIMIVLIMLLRRIPISKGEIIGCVLGFIGLIITLFDSLFLNSNNSSNGSNDVNGSADSLTSTIEEGGHEYPTLLGDFLALMGAVCIVFYLFAGAYLRTWMPLFCYAFPVTFIASIFCSIASLIIENSDLSIFAWLSPSFILLTCYLAVFPGFIGHTGMNAIIKYIEPVVISVVLLLEPPIGSLMGVIVGVTELPTFFTYIGGPFIICGCLLVTISSHIKNKKQQKQQQEQQEQEKEIEIEKDKEQLQTM